MKVILGAGLILRPNVRLNGKSRLRTGLRPHWKITPKWNKKKTSVSLFRKISRLNARWDLKSFSVAAEMVFYK